jgi:CheY-like chemotaxis protein
MKSKIILIVEENEQARKLFSQCISQLSNVKTAATGQEGLAVAASTSVDLILVSQQLPDLDGPSFLQKIRSMTACHCPVVALSAFAKEEDRPYFLDQGFDDLLTKPIRPREVILCLQRQLKKESQGPEEIQDGRVFDPEPLQQLLKYSSPETIKGIYAEFIQECKELLQLTDDPSSTPIPDELLRAIHTIKGNSGTLGAEKLFIYSKHSEFLGRQHKGIEFAESLHYLKAALSEFEAFLKKESSFYGF